MTQQRVPRRRPGRQEVSLLKGPGRTRPDGGHSAAQRVGYRHGIMLSVQSMRWPQLITFILAVLGLAISGYLTYTHFTNTSLLGCSSAGDGCIKVQTSPESEVFGVIPVAVLGLPFFLFMVTVNSPRAWKSRVPAIYWARLGCAATGMIFVLYLIYAELIEIGQICKYCTSVHVITFLLFSLIVFQSSSRVPEP
jgi:uncharacterized membrane protein